MNPDFVDKLLTCSEPRCGQNFVFLATEQDYYSRNRLESPKRCPKCREIRRTMKENGLSNFQPKYNQKQEPNNYLPMTHHVNSNGNTLQQPVQRPKIRSLNSVPLMSQDELIAELKAEIKQLKVENAQLKAKKLEYSKS
jgi:hypothetical protein